MSFNRDKKPTIPLIPTANKLRLSVIRISVLKEVLLHTIFVHNYSVVMPEELK